MATKITLEAKEEIIEALVEMEQETQEERDREWQENEWYEDTSVLSETSMLEHEALSEEEWAGDSFLNLPEDSIYAFLERDIVYQSRMERWYQ